MKRSLGMENNRFIWSGYEWEFQENTAWFIDAVRDILCCLNLQTGECDGIAKVPNDGLERFMLNTRCIRVKNEIYCMPCYGKGIWIYNIAIPKFRFIGIKNSGTKHLYMENCYLYEEEIYAVSRGMRQVVAIHVETKEVTSYSLNVRDDDVLLSGCIRVDTVIYCASYSNKIYTFDMNTKETAVYTILNEGVKLSSICFDGERFWLSGNQKKIYIWNKKQDTVQVIDNFPKEFGNYNFLDKEKEILDCNAEEYGVQLFCHLEFVGNYVWAIPYETNFVLYIQKDTLDIHILHIDDEEETQESLTRIGRRPFKYFWQYLRDEKFIGIFSLKNNCILEIDTCRLEVEKRKYVLSDNYVQLVVAEKVLADSDSVETMLFKRFIDMEYFNINSMQKNEQVGKRIYNFLR